MDELELNERFEKMRAELESLLAQLQLDIGDDYRASEEDTEPGMCVTIATNDDVSDWTYQTGDNSFSGCCYRFPHWEVIHLYRDSFCCDLAKEAVRGLADTIWECTE